jgi:hypothetical protein
MLQRMPAMRRTAKTTTRSACTIACVLCIVTGWSAPAAAQDDGSGLVTGGKVALMGAVPPLVTGAALFADSEGFIPGRQFSPYFLVPGAASLVAGATLLIAGAGRGASAGKARSDRVVALRAGPGGVVLRGAF